jgi:hypothetical protein
VSEPAETVAVTGTLPTGTLKGGCHCGAVRFEVDISENSELWHCNCSICELTGFEHLIVDREGFRLLSGEERLTEYRFNTGVARHLFCSVCGIKSFYVPRSHPMGYSVNARCIEGRPFATAPRRDFDGRNWEARASLRT